MNKIKLVSLVLSVAIILTGAGYAFWNDTVEIKSTVTTGELRVEFLGSENKECIEPPYLLNGDGQYDLNSSAYKLISNNRHTLTAEFKGVYPGVYYNIPFDMANVGTIPAVLDDCSVTWDILNCNSDDTLNEELGKYLLISNLRLHVHKKSGEEILVVIVNGSTIKLNELKGKLDAAFRENNIRLEPGDYAQLTSSVGEKADGYVKFLFSKDFGNDFQNREFTVNINMSWKQFNDLR